MTPADPEIWQSHWNAELDVRQRGNLLREPQIVVRESEQYCRIAGDKYLNFSSNDYLGLAQSQCVIEALNKCASRYGVGASASPLVTGWHEIHQSLEQHLCDWLGYDSAMLFSSGFAANHSVLSALADKETCVLLDKLSHASLIDGALHAQGKMLRYRHNDLAHLEQHLNRSSLSRHIVVSEGVFSMDGDSASEGLCSLARKQGALSILDDAHGIGVLGESGEGICATTRPDVLIIPFGKAVGTSGCAVLGSRALIRYLQQSARHYIYSTAMPLPMAAATLASFKEIQKGALSATLRQRIDYFKQHIQALPLQLLPSDTAIQPIVLGDETRALAWQRGLKQHGIWASAIRPPTVAKGSSRIRITLTALHTEADIDRLISGLQQVQKEVNHAA